MQNHHSILQQRISGENAVKYIPINTADNFTSCEEAEDDDTYMLMSGSETQPAVRHLSKALKPNGTEKVSNISKISFNS
ncbi:hypothetical protein llap_13556 [Limosa lapponica baueri]|uniref:Uncharacterized protein n=1 Tax=Limosa lapponica baueri TaxID=1758121 RepID=A0A2I0TQQ2_LIMLA|nr:hypothetical protein llap_13556 [Limosa lapponica baueri]